MLEQLLLLLYGCWLGAQLPLLGVLHGPRVRCGTRLVVKPLSSHTVWLGPDTVSYHSLRSVAAWLCQGLDALC